MLLHLYRAATQLGGPLIEAELRRRVRRGKEDPVRLPERLGQASMPRPPGPLVWLHAASIGESLAILPLLEALANTRPGLQTLITTGTVTSARLLAERLPAGARHQFAPVDRPAAWRSFFDHWRLDLALLIESELWPNLMLEAERRDVPLALLNARMSERSYQRWRRLPGTAAQLLAKLDLCLAQSDQDGDRLLALGANRVRNVGNLKHAAPPLPADPMALEWLRTAIGARPSWVAASTHPGEDEQIIEAHRRLARQLPTLLTVIVPRHPERGDAIAALLREHGLQVARRSNADPIGADGAVYLADTLGELGLFYRIAMVAFIGGSLVPHGGQNPLEAARLGCPVLLGPHTWNFAEMTAALERQGGARRVGDFDELAAVLGELLLDQRGRERMAAQARSAALSQGDVLQTTMDALGPLLAHALDRGHAGA